MKPPKRLFRLCGQLYVNNIFPILIPLKIMSLPRETERKKRLKNNPRKNNQWDLLLEPAAMYHQFTPHPRQAESAQPFFQAESAQPPTPHYYNQPIL